MRTDSTNRRPALRAAVFVVSLSASAIVNAGTPPPPAEVIPAEMVPAEMVPIDDPQHLERHGHQFDTADGRIRWARKWRTLRDVPPDVWHDLANLARNDECEVVRYEAVVTLWSLLAADGAMARPVQMVACRSKPRGLLRRVLSRVFGVVPRTRRSVLCVSPMVAVDTDIKPRCCEGETHQALSEIAAGCDVDGTLYEPSTRVRTVAAAALALCEHAGICSPPTPSESFPKPSPGQHEHRQPDQFQIEEPPPQSGGFEPLALAD